MATRRARVKLAPNLGLARNKTKTVQKPKIVVKSDTENSDAEQIADLDNNAQVRNVDVSKSFEKIEKLSNAGTDSGEVTAYELTESTNEYNRSNGVKEHVANSIPNIAAASINIENTTKITSPLPLKSSVVVSIPPSLSALSSSPPRTVFDIVTNPVQELPSNGGNADEESDWEDDQFTYKSVEVNENDEMYKSLEITPLSVNNVEVSGLDKAFLLDTAPVQNTVQPTVTPPPIVPNSHGPKVRLHLGKNKFKPNLNFDRRSRNISGGSRPPVSISPRSGVVNGSPLPRSRTISGSSTSSEPEIAPPNQASSPSPCLMRAGVSSIPAVSPKPARIRRTTERVERSHFMRRKLDHKKKFMKGVPDRGSMTMFDLIYYNPEYGQRMSVEEKDEDNVDNPDDPMDDNQQVPNRAEEVPEAEPATPERAAVAEEDSHPVPQVKVGTNGEIILDESSLQIQTNDQKKAKDLLQKSPVVFESNRTSTNYGTWSKKRRHSDWSERETIKFYKALSVFGSDFSMMESIFKNRSRQELKLKFKKEEKMNNKIVDKCLKEKGMFTDLNGLMDDSEEDYEVQDKGRGRKTKKKRPRRRYRNRGYYSSSEGEDADVETSKSPARKKTRNDSQDSQEERQMVRIKRPQVMHRDSVNHKTIRSLNPRAEAISLSQLAEQAKANGGMTGISVSSTQVPAGLPGVQFPPGLLAANPVLGAAKPGSLVVVASPNKTDPSSQLLHVYMVSAKNKERLDRDRGRSSSPRTPGSVLGSHKSDSPRMSLDPAVVRAVDRSRVERARTMSESGGKMAGRVRTASEDKTIRTDIIRTRQRTYSESGLAVRQGDVSKDIDLRTETIKRRFLSGSARSCPDLPPPSQNPTISQTPLPIARKSKPVELVETRS